MAYCFLNGEAFFTNGRVIGRVVGGGYQPLVLPVPEGDPLLRTIPGELEPGEYRIAMTFYDYRTDEESAASESYGIVVGPGEGILLEASPPMPMGMGLRVYVTAPNGEVLYQQTRWAQGIKTLDKGPALQTQYLAPLPAGHALAHYNGRLFVAHGNQVSYSEPWAYGLHSPEDNYFIYPAEVDVLVAVNDPVGAQGGVYVVADRTYFISGAGRPESREVEAFPYGGVRHTGIPHPGRPAAAWVSTKGVAVAGPSGDIKLLTEDTIAHPGYAEGALLYRELAGRHHFIATLEGGEASARASDTWS
jgi:hypothetical protein